MKEIKNMGNLNVSLNTKLEVAVEILATKIAITSNQGYTSKDKEIQNLLKEREEMYKGNLELIEKIIEEYGPEVKKKYKGA